MKRRSIYITILVCLLSLKMQAQTFVPNSNFSDTPKIETNFAQEESEEESEEDVKSELDQTPEVEEDTFITQTKAEIERLKIEAEKVKLELELAELKNADKETPLSPAEENLIRIKTQNLQLLNQKEQLLIKAELEAIEKAKSLKIYPHGVVYGHDIFRSNNFELYETTSEVVATEGYVLGTGDVMQIELWGFKYWSKSYIIGENGNINIKGYTNIFVKGLTLKQARSLIASRLGVKGNTSSLAVTVTRPRMVSVTILGEVFNPGTYTLPATNSAFNFLVAMGGPTDIGSVRNIYIKRDGLIKDSFDLYEYYNKTLHTRDVYLQNGDYVIVGPLANTVSIGGAIRKPGLYEIKNSDNLSQAIAMAGGTLKNAYLKDIVISRFKDSKYETISVNYDSLQRAGKEFNLRGVDQIAFKQIRSSLKVAIRVTGGVSVPGSYKLKSKMRISGVIKNANGLSNDAYTEKAYLVRTELKNGKKEFITFSPEDILKNPGTNKDFFVQNNDSIYIFKSWEITNKSSIQINGSVYKPFSSNYISNLKLGEFIFMAGGYTPDYDGSRGYILRTRDEFYKEIIPFTPDQVKTDSAVYNIEIMPKDVVRIFSRSDQFKKYYVRISGATIKKDTTLIYSDGLTIYDLIRLSGGLEEWAYAEKTILTRTDYASNKKITFVVNLDEILMDPKSKKNLILQRGDYIEVLDKRTMMDDFKVTISGPVRSPGKYNYTENLRLSSLILLAGGFESTAFMDRAVVLSTDIATGINTSKTIDLREIESDPLSAANVLIKPGDEVRVFDLLELAKDFNVYIGGPVKNPGEYKYSDNMSLQNLIDLSGGLDLITAGSRMEIIRNFYKMNGEYSFLKPKVILLPITNSLSVDSQMSNYLLQPFDRVIVRTNPNYVPLRKVEVNGAVLYPGVFALQGEDERINSVLLRSGGFKSLAYPEGAQLKRVTDGDTLSIILNSKKASRRKRSHYNYILKDGDVITVPYTETIVRLMGDINIDEGLDIGVYYKSRKRAKYFIRKFGGGFTKTSDKKNVIVEHKNGARVGTRNYILFKVYPKVRKGSKIIVKSKDPKNKAKGKSKVNIDTVLDNFVKRATAVLSLFVFYKIATSP